jgi:hypothetical protein
MSNELTDILNPPQAKRTDIWDNPVAVDRVSILKKYVLKSVLFNPLLLLNKNKLKSAVFARMKKSGEFIPHKFKKHFKHKNGFRQEILVNRIWNEKEFYYYHNHGWTLQYIAKYSRTYKIVAVCLIAIVAFIIFKRKKTKI